MDIYNPLFIFLMGSNSLFAQAELDVKVGGTAGKQARPGFNENPAVHAEWRGPFLPRLGDSEFMVLALSFAERSHLLLYRAEASYFWQVFDSCLSWRDVLAGRKFKARRFSP